MYILLFFLYNLLYSKTSLFHYYLKMYKLLNITFNNWNTYNLILGVTSDLVDLVISKHLSLFPKLGELKNIKTIKLYNWFADILTIEHIKLWKLWFELWKTPIPFSNIEITDSNINLFNSIISEWKWIILLKTQNYSEKRIEELFPKKEKIILKWNNKQLLKELINIYYKDRTKKDLIRNELWKFIKHFYLDTYLDFFKNKDIQIYKDINETFIFKFNTSEFIKNKTIADSNSNLIFDKNNIFTDDYVDIYYWDKLIRKKTPIQNITDKFIKKEKYSIKDFIQDSKLLTITYKQKVKYFYNVFLDKNKDLFKKKEDLNIFKSDIRNNYKTWWKNYFYDKNICSYEYILETSKSDIVWAKMKELTIYIPLFHLIKAIWRGIKEESKLKEVLNMYIMFLYDKFAFIENTVLKKSIESNVKQFIKLIKVIILFTEKYTNDIEIIKSRIKEIEKWLKLHYMNCIWDMNIEEINAMYSYLENNKIAKY